MVANLLLQLETGMIHLIICRFRQPYPAYPVRSYVHHSHYHRLGVERWFCVTYYAKPECLNVSSRVALYLFDITDATNMVQLEDDASLRKALEVCRENSRTIMTP